MKTAISIGLLFFLSGLTSLVYETLWVRVLSLGVGSTSTSLSIVLSIFFAGLSAGSWLAGKYISRVRRPVLFYGILEGAIGLYSLVLLPILFEFQYILSYLPLSGSFSWLGTILKFAIVLLLLAPPTTLMGASLPILIRIFVNSSEGLGKRISLLYGVNTLGAVAGAYLSGFVLIPNLGIVYANAFSALLNLLVLAAAYLIQKKLPALQATAHGEAGNAVSPYSKFQKMLPWVAAATGFSALAAEVVWNKYLGIFLGSNVFGLSLILSLFLLGIALGSLALSTFVERIKNKERLFQILLLVCAVSILSTTLLLNVAPVFANVISYYLPRIDLFLLKAFLAALILFPPGALLGALLPLAIRLRITKAEDSPSAAGKLYAINTIGSILGSCSAGLILIPLFGSGGAILVSLIVLFGVSLAVSLARGQRTLAAAHAVALALLPVASGVKFENIIKSAYLQQASPNLSFTEAMRYFSRDYEEFQLIVEGKTGIISLSHDPQDGPNYRDYLRLKTNGLNESIYDKNNLEALPKYEALLGFLPLALVRNPESAFVVGYGGGYTVDFLTSTDVKRVFVAELEEGILQAANYVHQGKNPLLQRKNLELQIEDARFLLASRNHGPFDIIVSQPSHSWLAGVANLFTEEFFLTVKDNLSEKGVFSQWLNLYNMNPEVLKSILRTFFTVFPEGYVFTSASDQELILLGSRSPLRFDLHKLEAMGANEKYRRQLVHVPIASGSDVLAQFALSREEVMKLTERARRNTDRNAFAEVTQSRLFYSERNPFPSRFLLEAFSGDFSKVVKDADKLGDGFYRGLLKSMDREPQRSFKVLPILDRIRASGGGTGDFDLAYQAQQMERYATAEEILNGLAKKGMTQPVFHLLISNLLSRGKPQEASAVWARHPQFQKDSAVCFGPEVAYFGADSRAADGLVRRIESEYDRFNQLCGPYLNKALGTYHMRKGNPKRAIEYLEAYYASAPADVDGYRALLASYILVGDQANGGNFFSSLSYVTEQEKTRLNELAGYYERKGFTQDAEALRERAAHL